MARRLSVCYAAPGHRLVPTAGSTRNMLSLADSLSAYADVTLAFRHADGGERLNHQVLVIDPGPAAAGPALDDAQRGLNPVAHLTYLRRLDRFARTHGGRFDVVLEKGWRLSGALAKTFRRYGVPGVVIENDIRTWSEPIRDARTLVRFGSHLASRAVVRRHRPRLPIIAETDALKAMLVRRGADADRVEVIGLGVDHRLFQPRDQLEARQRLGIDPTAVILVYVGAMDGYHDLSPIIEAMATAPGGVELHVAGDGSRRDVCEELAAYLGAAVRFHGRVPHEQVPLYIAAGDAGVVAYRDDAFPGHIVPFSTLKVPEYMACSRAVIGNAAGQSRALLEHGISGFLFPNERTAWQAFLADMPSREQLAEMGRAAAKAAESLSWERTAARYFEVCQRLVTTKGMTG
jgi:glycosyltransferase involved in cell wall biosynthesis